MFEFSVAGKYLYPKKRQLSVSLIALMSVAVISLVVWLLLLFLSVTEGMERGWLERLTALNGPLRITPTENYYNSYYYQIDSVSSASGYSPKTIGEKWQAQKSNPYTPELDEETPSHWPKAELNPDGSLKDPVKEAFSALQEVQKKFPDLFFQEYELSGALLRLQMLRSDSSVTGVRGNVSENFLTQVSYLSSFSDKSPYLRPLLLPLTVQDLAQLLFLSCYTVEGSCQDTPSSLSSLPKERASGQMQNLLANLGLALKPDIMKKELHNPSPALKTQLSQLFPPFLHKPNGVLLAKSFQENGVRIGDQGYLSYTAATMGAVQEQRISVHVAGFYDPGIMAVGNKAILVPPSIARTINASSNAYTLDKTLSNGIQVWIKDLSTTEEVKQALAQAFAKRGIAPYWKVTTFKEYDFARDLLQQFQSDKYLFTLVGIIILIVACCNIISLLVILVNDKKKEIGILQSMGASSRSIALIFGLCGISMGTLGALIGVGAALLTLHNIDGVVQLLSWVQGHEAFHAAFYGAALPNELSQGALLFILITTPLISLCAGLVPAFKACRLSPSAILRAE